MCVYVCMYVCDFILMYINEVRYSLHKNVCMMDFSSLVLMNSYVHMYVCTCMCICMQTFFEHSLVRYANKKLGRGHLIKDGMLGTEGATFDKDSKATLRRADAFQRYHGRNPDTGVKKWYRP